MAEQQQADQGVAGQPIYEAVAHPILEGLAPTQVHKFIVARERYVRIIDAKNALPGVNIDAVSLIDSVPIERLRSIAMLGLIEGVDDVDDITTANLGAYLDSVATRPGEDIEISEVRACLQGLRMDMSIQGGEARVIAFADSFLQRLSENGFDNVPTQFQETCNRLFHDRLEPFQLKKRMTHDVELDKELVKGSFRQFVRRCRVRAAAVESVTQVETGSKRRRADHWEPNRQNKKAKTEAKNKSESSTSGNNNKNTKPRTTPFKCLNPACSGYHLLRDCNVTPEPLKEKLLKEYRESKAKKKADAAKKKEK